VIELTQKWQAARSLLTTERRPLPHLRTALLLAALAGTTALVMYVAAHETGHRVVREEAAQIRPAHKTSPGDSGAREAQEFAEPQ